MKEVQMSKQTAIEWLYAHLLPYLESTDPKVMHHFRLCLNEAKAMEREQHKTSFNKGYDRRNYIHDFEYGGVEYWEEEPKEFEQYYNETYGGDK